MNIQNIIFLSPQFVYAILLIFLFIFLFFRLFLFRKTINSKYSSSPLRDQLSVPRSAMIYWVKLACICVGWLLAVFALMQPVSYGDYPEETRKKEYKKGSTGYKRSSNAIFFVIDSSASMSVSGKSGDLLSTGKEIIDLIISQMEGQQTSLISFTSEPTILSPLTFDYLFVRLMLQQLQINEGGQTGTNLTHLFDFLKKEIPTNLPATIFLFSDGGDTDLEFTSEENKRKRENAILESIKNLKRDNLKIYSIGLGSKEGIQIPGILFDGKPVVSKLNESLLKKIAEQGNGKYFYSEDLTSLDLADQLANIIKESDTKIDVSREQESSLFHLYYFQLPLAGAILLLCFILFLPDTNKRIQAIIAFSCIFGSDLKADLALEMLEAKSYADIKNYRHALEQYNQVLIQNLMPWQRAIVLYNIGTVHLKNNQYDEAIEILLSVPVKDYPNPLLKYNVSYNLILAYLKKAQSLQKRPSLAVDELKKAATQILETRKANCSLQLAKGFSECQELKDLIFLENVILEKLSVLLEQEKIDNLLHSTFNQGIKEIIKSINESEKNLNFLENENFQKGQLEQYQHLFLSEIQSWIPIWMYLKKQIKAPDKDKKMKLFVKAASHFLQALSHMEQQNFSKSKEQFELSKKNLEELIKFFPLDTTSDKRIPQLSLPEPSLKKEKENNKEIDNEEIEEITQMLIEMSQLDTIKKEGTDKRKDDSKPW